MTHPSSVNLQSAFDEADRIIEQSREYSIVALSPFDVQYPRSLLDLPDFPPVVYVKGDLSTLANPKKLAVVGTREASDLGLRLAHKIAMELSNMDVCVVGGLALGIDSAAHRGALKGAGTTIAVMAHGLDQVAPRSNSDLAEQILAGRGVLLSEHEVGVAPRPQQFVFRNRLQSGLSRGSIVVESGFSGGSIHQGKFTSQQNRLLFAVVPNSDLPGIGEFRREGADRLIREFAAKPVSCLDDILQALPEFGGAPEFKTEAQSQATSADERSDRQRRLF